MRPADWARRVSVSRSFISQVLSGKKPPPVGSLEMWADVLVLVDPERTAFIRAGWMANSPIELEMWILNPQRESIRAAEDHQPYNAAASIVTMIERINELERRIDAARKALE
jgi:transcriptional regulator with XRE-family HTH domain